MSGSQTVKGRTVDIDTNVFQLLGESQSLIPFMGYFEARYQDRMSLFVDVMYANITAGTQATKNFRVDPFVAGSVTTSVSMDYEQFTMEFGGTYQVAKVGPDRSAEGPGMAGVGQTAFDVLLGGRYWYQKVDMTLNAAGTIGLNVGDLELSRDGTRAYARSGSVSWVDPLRRLPRAPSAGGGTGSDARSRSWRLRPWQPDHGAGDGRLCLRFWHDRRRGLGRRNRLPRAVCRL